MSAAQKETPDSAATGQASEQITDSRIIGSQDFADKRLATIAAQLELKGFALHRLTCGGFLIARWDRYTYCPDVRAAAAFLERVEGRQ